MIEAFRDMKAVGVMTSDGQVFPIKAVLAADRLNDAALFKIDATNLTPLPLAQSVPVGATIYCLSHPIMNCMGTEHGFFAFTQGIVSGRYRTKLMGETPVNVLTITADYCARVQRRANPQRTRGGCRNCLPNDGDWGRRQRQSNDMEARPPGKQHSAPSPERAGRQVVGATFILRAAEPNRVAKSQINISFPPAIISTMASSRRSVGFPRPLLPSSEPIRPPTTAAIAQ